MTGGHTEGQSSHVDGQGQVDGLVLGGGVDGLQSSHHRRIELR